jgi:hypothetical protein
MELQKHNLWKTNFPSEVVEKILETKREDNMGKGRSCMD